MQIQTIKEQLQSRMPEVCQFLFPNGRQEGHNWNVGSTEGEAGNSLRIKLLGDKAGVWADFSGTDRGDILELWKLSRKCDFLTAKKEAELFLGGDPIPVEAIQKEYSTPAKLSDSSDLKSFQEADNYFLIERCIKREIVEKFRIRFLPKTREFVFPYISRDTEEVKNRKYIGLDRPNGKKQCRSESNGFPILFGWHGIKPDRDIIICEGEIDCLTWNQIGFECLSVPYGVKNLDWIAQEWDSLEAFETIYLSMDMDGPGQSEVTEIAKRLGMGKCKIVKLEHKDANECLQKGWTDNDFVRAIKTACHLEIKKIIDVHEAGKILDQKEANPPSFFEFSLVPAVKFGKSELTLWAGYTNHGKTSVLNNLTVEAAMHDLSVFVASMEQSPDEILSALQKIISVNPMPNQEEKTKCRKLMAGKVFFLNHVGSLSVKQLFVYLDYVCQRFAVKHAIIDSLMMLDLPSEDFNGQKKLAADLRLLGTKYKCDIHLVIHTTKEFEERNMKMTPSLNILRGSADVGHACDNAFFVRRNPNKFESDENQGECDTLLLCLKNRNGGYRGTVDLAYERLCGQFSKGMPFKPKNYINWVKP